MVIGARVRYIRIDNEEDKATGYYPPFGALGTVVETSEYLYRIKWDSGTEDGAWFCEYSDVELLEEEDINALLYSIQHYGTFTADFECEERKGVAVRVRTADYDGKKYFIVQRGGKVVTIKEI